MRFERLVIEAGDSAVTLDLHPRLTVIGGVGRAERDALAAELLGALLSNRTGVHLEAVEDGGRSLAVFRPTEGGPRVVDVDRAVDVSREYLDADGRLSLPGRTGLDRAAIRRALRFGPADLHAASQGAALVRRLAAADQARLWSAADRLLQAERVLQSESDELGTSPEDAEVIERVEERHRRMEAAQARHERIRKLNLAITAASLIGAVVARLRVGDGPAVGLLLVACVSMLSAVVTRNQAAAARRAEAEALAAAGAQSYLGFHLQRVNGMLSSDQARQRLVAAAANHRRAVTDWEALAGDIPPVWAVEHHEEVAAAARVRSDLAAHATLATEPADVDDGAAELARVLVERLSELRQLGTGSESYPLVLDDPFADVDRSAKPALLELLSHSPGAPQLLYLTEDEDVASWARLEALTGALSIVEPAAERATAARLSRSG